MERPMSGAGTAVMILILLAIVVIAVMTIGPSIKGQVQIALTCREAGYLDAIRSHEKGWMCYKLGANGEDIYTPYSVVLGAQ